jgi:hypothetical protein
MPQVIAASWYLAEAKDRSLGLLWLIPVYDLHEELAQGAAVPNK